MIGHDTTESSTTRRILFATALIAMGIVVVRACIQSVTIDEADTYHLFVNRTWPAHWYPASNNHVLNSMLIALFTSVFGPSHLSLRAPAILGAGLYISAACTLCRLISTKLSLQWPLFVCLVFNPFVLDYLAAARGYSLALGFLMSSLTAAAWTSRARLRPRRELAAAAFCSVSAALTFAANFSFAFVSTSALLVAACWIAFREEELAS